MKKILFFKGNHQTIILPENSPKIEIFYKALYDLFKARGYEYRKVETNSAEQLKERISPSTHYLIGHSQGATRILEQFSPETYPQIKGVVLFDPQQHIEDRWNSLKIPKLLFFSTKEQRHDYTNFQDKIEIDDDHYFVSSIEKIVPILEKFIS